MSGQNNCIVQEEWNNTRHQIGVFQCIGIYVEWPWREKIKVHALLGCHTGMIAAILSGHLVCTLLNLDAVFCFDANV